MLAGPILRWEITSSGRRRRYFLVRVIYAAILLLVLWSVYESMLRYARYNAVGAGLSIEQTAAAAWRFFVSYSWVQMLGVIAVVPAIAVGTIATERERRTIEYLFATDLSNAEIVLGKVGSRLLLAGKFLLVGLPIVLMFRLLGGIPLGLVLGSTILAASTATMLIALATCVSVWSKRSRDATLRVYLVLVALLFVVPMIWGVWMATGSAPAWAWIGEPLGWLVTVNPITVLQQLMVSGFTGGSLSTMGMEWREAYVAAGWHLAIAAALTALATAAVRRVHLREVGSAVAAASRRRWLPQLPRWRPTIGDRPMIWKEAFAGSAKSKLGFVGNVATLLIGATVVGFTAYAFYESAIDVSYPYGAYPRYGREFGEYLTGLTGIFGSALVLLATARSAGLITYEKERDCWLSLLSTPLTGAEIVQGKVIGNLYSLRGGFLLLVAAWALGLWFDVRFVFAALASAATLTLAAVFATLVGLAYSLRSPTTLRATGYALATVLFVGGGYLFCCCALTVGGGGGGDAEVILAAFLPLLYFYPIGAFQFDLNSSGMGWRFEERMFPPFILALIIYSIAVAILYSVTVGEFERLAGRNTGLPEEAGPKPGKGRMTNDQAPMTNA